MTSEKTQGNRRTLQGRVVSDKMNKTVTVQVQRLVKHPRYRKYVTRSKTYKAHDENNTFKVGDFGDHSREPPVVARQALGCSV